MSNKESVIFAAGVFAAYVNITAGLMIEASTGDPRLLMWGLLLALFWIWQVTVWLPSRH